MLEIFYEDGEIVICEKPVGVLSQPDVSGQGEDMLGIVADHITNDTGKQRPYVGLVHRLDRGVGGVMVFAKTPEAASRLSVAVAEHRVTKQYLAIVHGVPEAPEGIWQDLLYKDAGKGKSFVVDRPRKGVKSASLAFRLLGTVDSPHGTLSLLQIRLHTGRTHQIRVQCASRGLPLLGDGKYGARDHGCDIGLWSYRLTFAHPRRKGETVDVCRIPTEGAFALFGDIKPADDLPAAPKE